MDENLTFSKTRLAPTPSGYLHLGNVLSFAITAALAEKTGAKIVLRIDDVDRERTNKLYVQDIFDTLNFLEIPWHEGPRDLAEFDREYSQMCRMELYTSALQQLRENEAIFACTCSRADVARLSPESSYMGTCSGKKLPTDTPNASWRLHTEEPLLLPVKTIHGTVIDATLPPSMRDFVVKKRDTFPAYQLTSLIDDIHFGIDLVVRGEDLWASTLAQQYLSKRLGLEAFQHTTFFHHPLLVDDEGHKLSKSLGATSVQYFRKQHKKPEDIYAIISGILGVQVTLHDWRELVGLLQLSL